MANMNGIPAGLDEKRKRARALLAQLLKDMPLKEVCNIIGVALPERHDLRAIEMQPMMRKLNDTMWELVDVDTDYDEDRRPH